MNRSDNWSSLFWHTHFPHKVKYWKKHFDCKNVVWSMLLVSICCPPSFLSATSTKMKSLSFHTSLVKWLHFPICKWLISILYPCILACNSLAFCPPISWCFPPPFFYILSIRSRILINSIAQPFSWKILSHCSKTGLYMTIKSLNYLKAYFQDWRLFFHCKPLFWS